MLSLLCLVQVFLLVSLGHQEVSCHHLKDINSLINIWIKNSVKESANHKDKQVIIVSCLLRMKYLNQSLTSLLKEPTLPRTLEESPARFPTEIPRMTGLPTEIPRMMRRHAKIPRMMRLPAENHWMTSLTAKISRMTRLTAENLKMMGQSTENPRMTSLTVEKPRMTSITVENPRMIRIPAEKPRKTNFGIFGGLL